MMMKSKAKVALWVVTGAVALLLLLQTAVIGIFTARGYSCYAVATGSMEPTLPVGSLVVVEKLPFDRLEEGQLLTFRAADDPKKTFTHRAVQIDREQALITTRGDANNTNDPTPTEAEYCIGRVTYSFPLFGFVYLFFSSPAGPIVLGLLALFWLSFEVESLIRKKKEGKSCAGD